MWIKEEMTEIEQIVDEWLEAQVWAWEDALGDLEADDAITSSIATYVLDNIPDLPGNISYQDLFNEIRRRKKQ